MVKSWCSNRRDVSSSRYILQGLLLGLIMLTSASIYAKQMPESAAITGAQQQFNTPNASCMAQFANAQPPVLLKKSLTQQTYALCFEQFAVQYSGLSKTPIWVAEFLTPQRLAKKVKREDVFHPEPRVAAQHQAWLSDYRDSGFDRGHMAASGNMGSRSAQAQSFSLANIVPQNREHNQNVWRELEEATRALVSKQHLRIYVLTGPLYEGAELQQIGRGVLVPSAIFKVLYIPELQLATAYVSPNNAAQQVSLMSVCALEQRAGINLLPQLDASIKRNIYQLPLSAKQVKKQNKISLIDNDQRSICTNAPVAAQREAQRQFQNATMPQDSVDDVNALDDDASERLPSSAASSPNVSNEQWQQAVLSRLMDWVLRAVMGWIKSL